MKGEQIGMPITHTANSVITTIPSHLEEIQENKSWRLRIPKNLFTGW